MFTEINFSTATVRELRQWAKDNKVPGYSKYVTKGVQSLRDYLAQYKHDAELSTEMEAECEGYVQPEYTEREQEVIEGVFGSPEELAEDAAELDVAPAPLTRTEKAIGVAIDACAATITAGEVCGEFYFTHAHERLVLALEILIALCYCACLGWAAAYGWAKKLYLEWREPVKDFVVYHAASAFYDIVENLFYASKSVLEAGMTVGRLLEGDKPLAFCYAAFVGLSLAVLR